MELLTWKLHECTTTKALNRVLDVEDLLNPDLIALLIVQSPSKAINSEGPTLNATMNDSRAEKEQDIVNAQDAPPTNDIGDGGEGDMYKIDTVHTDEAMKVLAAYSGNQTWTAKEEKKVRNKIDKRLLPILVVTYALQYYDKTMISQAVSLSQGLHPHHIPLTRHVFTKGPLRTSQGP